MKKIVIGILAHVDAGKTTLSESMLYLSGKIRTMGRVDNKDAYLDTYELEKARGITIFSKQALLQVQDVNITLLDTPGHVDFSAEMERTLQVLDYAILVINGADGVQGHTKTLWRLLESYGVPAFVFVNKMDQNGTDKHKLIKELKNILDDRCVGFEEINNAHFLDEIAMCDEELMDTFLERGTIEQEVIAKAIRKRRVFPCYFGSALKLEGVEDFMRGMLDYSEIPVYEEAFGAKVFKITRDEQGNRLTFMKVTGGSVKVKMPLGDEKINQIRLYSGQKFDAVNEVGGGSICAVTGLTNTYPGQGLGGEEASQKPILDPVLFYQLILPDGCDPRVMLPKLRELEEEEPTLRIIWDEPLQEIQVQLMGEVQTEILQRMIVDRFGIEVSFGEGTILYKETIEAVVEGVGHFEPLRHYAEVHVLLEPLKRGRGIEYAINCSEDVLDKNWQRLILSHLQEKTHKGVLIGVPITDIRITLVAGRAHKKHTEGGDFREATFRAVRQGLKEAQSLLLEPYYSFQLELPERMVGRAMTDIEKLKGNCEIAETNGEMTTLIGSAPVATMRNYQKEVIAYTKGEGKLFCSLKGYEPCHNTEDIVEKYGYDSERDLANPTGSVFCAHGTGFLVNWDKVKDYMHIESCLKITKHQETEQTTETLATQQEEAWIGLEEIDSILNKTYYSNQGEKVAWKKKKTTREAYFKPINYTHSPFVKREAYLLVDGYNIIFAWEDLRELAEVSIDAARMKLQDYLCDYQGIKNNHIIVVFDAYRVEGHQTEWLDYLNIHVVYTKEAETADHYIEKFVHANQGKYDVTVATSDGLEQIIIRGKGSKLLSARELKEEIEYAKNRMMETYNQSQEAEHHYLGDLFEPQHKEEIEAFIKEK